MAGGRRAPREDLGTLNAQTPGHALGSEHRGPGQEEQLKQPLAVVTMFYNEPRLLPIWFSYYSGQVGAENLYVLDHGSDDGSQTLVEACSVLRLPRTDQWSEAQRAYLVGKFCASLLAVYDRVLYVDSDEFVVADPDLYGGLLDYTRRATTIPQVVTTFGVDVLHDFAEPPLDPNGRILAQRKWCAPNAFVCKPLFIGREVTWSPGFHHYDGGTCFDDLFLFHLANADRQTLVERQLKRNRSVPADGNSAHFAHPPETMLSILANKLHNWRRADMTTLSPGDPEREAFLDGLFEPDRPREEQRTKPPGTTSVLLPIPARFTSCL